MFHVEETVQGNIGYPDLNTSNSIVQSRVLSYLKELIDDGVTGFRFDAAKHIETSQDGDYASTFWENTLGAAKTYAGSDIFAYGEILGPGPDREYSDYTDHAYMDAVTDSYAGEVVRNAITSDSSIGSGTYYTDLSAGKNVLWAESHDTYMDDTTSSYSQDDMDRVYALLSAREDANLLYFVRPSGTFGTPNTSRPWENDLVKAANTFHKKMAGNSEYFSSSSGASIVERAGTTQGAVIVNTGASLTISLSHIDNGSYLDLVSGDTYTVASNELTVPADTALVLVES